MGPGVRASFLKAAGLGRFVTAVNLAAEAPRFFATEPVSYTHLTLPTSDLV